MNLKYLSEIVNIQWAILSYNRRRGTAYSEKHLVILSFIQHLGIYGELNTRWRLMNLLKRSGKSTTYYALRRLMKPLVYDGLVKIIPKTGNRSYLEILPAGVRVLDSIEQSARLHPVERNWSKVKKEVQKRHKKANRKRMKAEKRV